MTPRAIYTPEFKLKVVKEVVIDGKRPSQVARDHRVLASTLFSWRAMYERFGESAFITRDSKQEVLEVLEAENEALRKQLEKVREKEVTLERLLGQMMLESHRMRERYSKTG